MKMNVEKKAWREQSLTFVPVLTDQGAERVSTDCLWAKEAAGGGAPAAWRKGELHPSVSLEASTDDL